jgi:hypothetical protein
LGQRPAPSSGAPANAAGRASNTTRTRERLARAKALGELERQEKASAASILDLSGDIQAAKRDRAQQQEREAQAERQRIERMNSTELAQEIGRLRPPRWIAW